MATLTKNNPKMGLSIVQRTDTVGTIVNTYNEDVENIASRLVNFLNRIQSLEEFIDSEADFVKLYASGENAYTLRKALDEIDARLAKTKEYVQDLYNKYNSYRNQLAQFENQLGHGLIAYKNQLVKDAYADLAKEVHKALGATFSRVEDRIIALEVEKILMTQMHIKHLIEVNIVYEDFTDDIDDFHRYADFKFFQMEKLHDDFIRLKEGTDALLDQTTNLVGDATSRIHNEIELYLRSLVAQAEDRVISTKFESVKSLTSSTQSLIALDYLREESEKYLNERADSFEITLGSLVVQAEDRVTDTNFESVQSLTSSTQSLIALYHMQEGSERYLSERADLFEIAQSKKDDIIVTADDKLYQIEKHEKTVRDLKEETEDISNKIKSDVVVIKGHTVQVMIELAIQEEITQEFVEEKADFDNTKDSILQMIEEDRKDIQSNKIYFNHVAEDVDIFLGASKQNKALWQFSRVFSELQNQIQSLEYEGFKEDITVNTKYQRVNTRLSVIQAMIAKIFAMDARLITLVNAN